MECLSQMPCETSILVPVFNEAESIPELVDLVATVFNEMGAVDRFEILFVDDGSTDATPQVLQDLARQYAFVRFVRLRRNCGKSLGLMAGFKQARGQVVITMDGDLQDNPGDIPRLLDKINEGFDLVNGWRQNRHDTAIRKMGSRLYNLTVRRASGLDLQDMNCGMKAYRRKVVETLCVYGQYHRYIPLQAHLSGFKVTEIAVTNNPRKYGVSKFPTFRYHGLFDLLSLLFVHKYSLNPLHFFGTVSVAIIGPAMLVLTWFFSSQIFYWLGMGVQYRVVNRPLLGIALTAFLFGVFVFFTGFVCDFILHHQIRKRIDSILDLAIDDEASSELTE